MKIFLIIILFALNSCIDFSPQKPVEVTVPKSVTTRAVDRYPHFIVEIKNDKTVWYNSVDGANDTVLTRIDSSLKESLKTVIADYKNKLGDKNSDYVIRCNSETVYQQFKTVIEAFKENGIYKFKMVQLTDEKQN